MVGKRRLPGRFTQSIIPCVHQARSMGESLGLPSIIVTQALVKAER